MFQLALGVAFVGFPESLLMHTLKNVALEKSEERAKFEGGGGGSLPLALFLWLRAKTERERDVVLARTSPEMSSSFFFSFQRRVPYETGSCAARRG